MAYPDYGQEDADVAAQLANVPTSEPTFTTPALAVEALKLQRRKEALKAQATAASQALGNMPKGQMVGNGGFQHYVAPHWSQMLGPVVQSGLNRLDQRQFDSDEAAFAGKDAAAARAHMANQPAVDASIKDKIQWAQAGSQIPSLKPLMDTYVKDQLVSEPDRVAARKDKADQAVAAQQARADEAQRQRDFLASQNQANRDLRQTIADQVAASRGGSGGSKASDFQIITDNEGNAIRVNKLTGEQFPVGKVGKPSAANEKAQADATTSVSNAKDGLAILESMKPLFDKATQGGLRADIEKGYSYATGESTDAQAALKDLGIKAANLAKYADRKMFGPQFTDADVKAIRESVGNFQNATSYKDRMAAYNAVKEIFERQAKVPTSFSQDSSSRKAANSPGGGLPRVSSDADFDALPSGARFMDPNGQVRTKP